MLLLLPLGLTPPGTRSCKRKTDGGGAKEGAKARRNLLLRKQEAAHSKWVLLGRSRKRRTETGQTERKRIYTLSVCQFSKRSAVLVRPGWSDRRRTAAPQASAVGVPSARLARATTADHCARSWGAGADPKPFWGATGKTPGDPKHRRFGTVDAANANVEKAVGSVEAGGSQPPGKARFGKLGGRYYRLFAQRRILAERLFL